MSKELKGKKYTNVEDFQKEIQDFTGLILIKNGQNQETMELYIHTLVPNNYKIFDANYIDIKIEKIIPLNIGINLYKYQNGTLLDYKNNSLGYWSLLEWLEDLKLATN